MKRGLFGLPLCLVCACADTGGGDVSFPLYVAGVDVSEPFATTEGVPVVLERADLAFGPLYLCAGTQAGDLCETARLEWLGSVIVTTTSPEARVVGDLAGVTGQVRSYMYDLGFASLLTTEAPLVMPAARELGGVSLSMVGTAEMDGISVPFIADVPIRQTSETGRGLPVVRKSTNEAFSHEVEPGEKSLLVEFDPRPWLASVDFRALIENAGCEANGCGARLAIGPETQAFRAISNAVVAGSPPIFEWSFEPR